MDKSAILSENGYPEWEYDFAGRLRCPHGNICDEDGYAPCGCKSPLLELVMV
jgi:hypothetical protein